MRSEPNYLPLGLVIGLIILWFFRSGASVLPEPQPAGPDLVAAFATNDNRAEAVQHAHVFATICDSLADCIEYDGTREAPLIKTGVDIDELRRGLRQTRMRGWSFLTKYPGLDAALAKYFAAEVGTAGGPIDAAQRKKWVNALRQLAKSSDYAARRG